MVKLLVIGLGGSVGAVARYALSAWVHRGYEGEFPRGTLLVNLLGCFVLGVILTLVQERQAALSPNMRLFLTVGLLGSLTTFSTFGYQTFELLEAKSHWLALGNVAGNVVLGILGVVLGRVIMLKVLG